MSSIVLSLFVLLVLIVQVSAQCNVTGIVGLSIGSVYSFESPAIPTSPGYTYAATAPVSTFANTPCLPWTFSPTIAPSGPGCGIARAVSGNPFNPQGNIVPPDGSVQYVFLQVTSASVNPAYMSTIMTGLTVGSYYYINFAYGTRNAAVTPLTLSVVVNNNTLIFDAEHVGDTIGWIVVNTTSFQATSSSMSLIFVSYNSNAAQDNSVLLDVISVNAGLLPTVQYYAQLNTPYSFESPVLPSAGYAYSGEGALLNYPAPVWPSATLPFLFIGETGIANNGTASGTGPFNGYPASSFIPPHGNQYAIIQSGIIELTEGPTNVLYPQASLVTTFLTVGGSSTLYNVSFYYSVRNYTASGQTYYGNTIIGNFTLTANNIPILVIQNVTANLGWIAISSSLFSAGQVGVSASGGAVTLAFTLYAYNTDDHTMDVDLILISTATASSSSTGVTSTGGAASSSSTGTSNSTTGSNTGTGTSAPASPSGNEASSSSVSLMMLAMVLLISMILVQVAL